MQVIYKLKSGGGLEQLAFDLSTYFNNDSFETVVVGFKNDSLTERLNRYGVPVFSLDKESGFDRRFITRFHQIVRELNPHILHAHALSPNFWSTLIGKHFHKKKSISTFHTVISDSSLFMPFYTYINLFSDRLIAVSNKVKSTYSKNFKVDSKKIGVIHNGVALPSKPLRSIEIEKFKEELGLNPFLRTAICVGRLEKPKGHKFMIEAAHILAQKGMHLNFLIVGGGTLENELGHLARSLGLQQNFIFTGYRSDVPNLIQSADYAVISSVREGFSVALLEFMAMGMPLVITDVGGNREAVTNDVSAIIVPPRDPQALAAGIERLIQQPALARKLGKAANKRYMQKFTKEQMLQQYELLYRQLVV
jgi:glycosyltransferase involved in cell wall biosynthesis